MTLPPEVAELVIDRCRDRPTLASCSLVCKAWRTRARFRLFAAAPVIAFDVPGVPRVRELLATLKHPLCTLHPFIQSLSIRQSSLSASWLNPVIPTLVGLSNLTSLEIFAEHSLLSAESQALFQTHFRSLRHLSLCLTFTTFPHAVTLVCSFPLLESLHLHAQWIGASPASPSSLPPNLHTLDVGGFLEDVLVWLLSCPPSPAVSSVQLRDVAHHEFGIVFRYLRFVEATLKSFHFSFLDKRSEKTFLDSNFDVIHAPGLRALGVEGRLSDDVTLMVHLLAHFDVSQLEEVSFTCLIAVNHRRPAWAQLDAQLSSPANICLRKVAIITLPHLESGIKAALPCLDERRILDFVFPKGLSKH
ncbi:ATP-dependent DNA helicase [Mycena sanguinolenta]|uniref:ATP-dependent DNA helicase n=1 Tax=Mycena sanguinolenta TaxID=230812 RepID=A0A8H7DK52_9AGAR|nr:ATP-dependent DNA helicase [Mycena sanguinolenta]